MSLAATAPAAGGHRSRLTKARAADAAEAARLAALRGEVEGAIARFSAVSVPIGTGTPYHAAQTTRHRQFPGELGVFGVRPRPEEDYLRPYDRAVIISRTRIMVRNNPWLAAIFLAYVQEIGTPTYKSAAILADSEATRTYNDRRERLFERWASDCESGDDLSLAEVVEIAGFEDLVAGELFIVKLATGELQLVPSELCGSAKTGSAHLAGATYLDGLPVAPGTVEKDGLLRLGRRVVGYRFAARDAESGAVDFEKSSFLVRREYVRHLYDRDRVEQGRGVPKVAPILGKLQDLFETTDARSQQVKNAACLSMWITKNIDPYGYAEAMKGAMRVGNVQDAVALKEIADQRSAYKELRAGAVYYGATNESVNLIEPKLNAADWIEHYIGLCQICCACLDGMPVEVGIEGFRRSTYSSARATMNKWKRNVRRRRARLETKLLDDLQLWITRRAELFGDLPPVPVAQAEECLWGWPPIPEIDGTKTAAQNAVELANGSTNLRRIYADKGLHYEIEVRQYAEERIQFVRALAAEAQATLKLPADKALAWAMTAAPGATSPALAAILADAFTTTGEPARPAPAPAE